MTNLHPVQWQIERTSPDGYYAFGFGGGLPEAVTTDSYPTQAEALLALRAELRKVGRTPDPANCNLHCEGGRELFALLSR